MQYCLIYNYKLLKHFLFDQNLSKCLVKHQVNHIESIGKYLPETNEILSPFLLDRRLSFHLPREVVRLSFVFSTDAASLAEVSKSEHIV